MRLKLGIAALAATLAAGSPASAQLISSTAEAEARGVVLTAQSLTKESDLDFGIVTVDPDVAGGSDGGTVTIEASAAGTRTASDADVTLLPSTSSAARFLGYGAPNQTVDLTLVQPAGNVLVNANGDQIEATLNLDNVGPITTNAGGQFTSFVGGVFTIDATQAAGLYTADFNLTAEFQ